jgi:hypothetical protein
MLHTVCTVFSVPIDREYFMLRTVCFGFAVFNLEDPPGNRFLSYG